MLRATPPGEDGIAKANSDLYTQASRIEFANQPDEENGRNVNYLNLVAQAINQGQTYVTQNVQRNWDRSIRAFRNEHFAGSKYTQKEYRLRSQIFRPKTRAAVRKDMAAAASSLFSTTDAISCEPGDESSLEQRASAAIIKELLNYRTDRTGGRAAIPWFRVSMGARQDALLQSVCCSKQSWKLEQRVRKHMQPVFDLDPATGEPVLDPLSGEPLPLLDENGQEIMEEVEVTEILCDRPDVQLIPLENVIIDPAADWLDPIQTSAYFIVKFPMRKYEIEAKQRSPMNPWHKVEWEKLRASDRTKTFSQSVRQSREGGQDRFDQTATGTGDFEVVWVHEVFMRVGDEDVHFWSIDDRAYLTDPVPVDEVYPAHGGERPYTWGIASLEAHRLFPMAPAESWQPMQQEINDLANLRLDQVKLNVSPVAFVTRGRNIDLAALQRRGPNSIILRTGEDDIEWDRPPEVPNSAYAEMERLNSDFDDLAGQFNSASVQTNRSMNETVGGMKLIAGNANVVGEFDLRTWIETWVEPTLAQVVKLLQYYESDERVLALCGERAKLFQKFGVDQITDELLQEQVTVRVNVGIGNGSPQERLGKFAAATQTIAPMWGSHPKVQSGELELDIEEIFQEVFGLTGYRDGGKRFIKKGQPRANPVAEAEAAKKQAETQDKEAAARLKEAQAKQVGVDTQLSVAEMMHGAMMDRAQLVHKARTERESFTQNKADKDADREFQREESDANRSARREEMSLRQQGQGNAKAAGKGTVEQAGPEDETKAMMQEILGLLQMLVGPRVGA
jgi:hypothetical protein